MQDLTPQQLDRQKRVRRTHSKAFKARLVAMAEADGASVAQIAMDNKINANQLRRWMKESYPRSESQTLLPVSVAVDTSIPASFHPGTVVMELSVCSSTIRIHHAWDPQAVATLIKALQ